MNEGELLFICRYRDVTPFIQEYSHKCPFNKTGPCCKQDILSLMASEMHDANELSRSTLLLYAVMYLLSIFTQSIFTVSEIPFYYQKIVFDLIIFACLFVCATVVNWLQFPLQHGSYKEWNFGYIIMYMAAFVYFFQELLAEVFNPFTERVHIKQNLKITIEDCMKPKSKYALYDNGVRKKKTTCYWVSSRLWRIIAWGIQVVTLFCLWIWSVALQSTFYYNRDVLVPIGRIFTFVYSFIMGHITVEVYKVVLYLIFNNIRPLVLKRNLVNVIVPGTGHLCCKAITKCPHWVSLVTTIIIDSIFGIDGEENTFGEEPLQVYSMDAGPVEEPKKFVPKKIVDEFQLNKLD